MNTLQILNEILKKLNSESLENVKEYIKEQIEKQKRLAKLEFKEKYNTWK